MTDFFPFNEKKLSLNRICSFAVLEFFKTHCHTAGHLNSALKTLTG